MSSANKSGLFELAKAARPTSSGRGRGRRKYYIIASLMLVVLMLGAACGLSTPVPTPTPTLTPTVTPTPQPTPTPTAMPSPTPTPSPQSLLQEVLAKMTTQDSFHIEGDMQVQALVEGLDQEISMSYSVVGDFQAPDRTRAAMVGDMMGIAIEAEYMVIRDEMLVLNQETGEWDTYDMSLLPFSFEDFFGIEPAEIEQLQLVGEETLDGVQVYHLKGQVLPGAISEMAFGGFAGGGEVEYEGGGEVEYWIGVEDHLPRQVSTRMEVTGSGSFGGLLPAGEGEDSTLIEDVGMTIKLSDFGQDVSIEPVRLPTPTPVRAQPTPVGVRLSELLEDSLAATVQEESYHLVIDARIGFRAGGLRGSMPFVAFEGDVQNPDRMAGNMSLSLLGTSMELDVIVIGDTAYALNPEFGVWEESLKSAIVLFPPEDFLLTDPSEIEDLIFIGEEELDGIQVYHLRGGLPALALDGSESLSQVDYWVGVDSPRLRQVTQVIEQTIPGEAFPLVGGGAQDMKSGTAVTMKFSDFGKPVTIEPPAE